MVRPNHPIENAWRPVAAIAVALLFALAVPIAPTGAQEDPGQDLPDLVIEAVTLSDPQPEPGDTIEIAVRVANIGAGDADGWFAVWGQLPTDHFWMYEHLLGLASGANTTLLANWTATEGVHSFRFEVDPFNGIEESNETNNEYGFDLIVGDPKPDLYVRGLFMVPADLFDAPIIEPWPSVIREGDAMVLNVDIGNGGTAPVTEPFDVRFTIGDEVFDEQTVTPDPDRSHWEWLHAISAPWNATLGNHEWTVDLDVHDAIDEKNETNNSATLTVGVIAADAPVPDLAVIAVDAPESAQPGDWFQLTATIANIGDEDAPAFDTILDVWNIGRTEVRFPSMAVGDEATISVSGRLPVEGPYWNQAAHWSIIVDPYWAGDGYGGEVPEDDETNNYWYGSTHVRLPDLYVADVRLPDGPYRGGDWIEVEVDIANGGDGYAPRVSLAVWTPTWQGDLTVPSLPPGGVYTTHLMLIPHPSVGAIRLDIDPDRRIAEIDRTNNRYEAYDLFELNLAVTDLTHDAEGGVVWTGDHVNFRADIANLGNVWNEQVQVEWYIDGVLQRSEQVTDWNGNGEMTSIFTWRPVLDATDGALRIGEHEVSVRIVPDWYESDWSDNEAAETVLVKLTPLPPWV